MSTMIQINKPAPDFFLPDFEGTPFHLSDSFGEKNILLVFNRGFT